MPDRKGDKQYWLLAIPPAILGIMGVSLVLIANFWLAQFENTFHRPGKFAVSFQNGIAVGIVTPNLNLDLVATYSECGLGETVAQVIGSDKHPTRKVKDAGWWIKLGIECEDFSLENSTFGSGNDWEK